MDVSIIICTRNRPERLANAIASALRQGVRPLEIVVVDDGDLSVEFINELATQIQEKGIGFQYFHKPEDRRGLTISRNIGWRMARGEIVQFMDDDAELDPDCLMWVVKVFTIDKSAPISCHCEKRGSGSEEAIPDKGGGNGIASLTLAITREEKPTLFRCARNDVDEVGHQLVAVDFPIREQTRSRQGRRVIEHCYQLAGLWKVGRRFVPKRPFPKVTGLVPMEFLQGGSLAVPKRVLEAIGGFDESLTGYALGEDKEISIRLAKVGVLARINAVGVAHFSDPAGRIDPKRMGFETSFNYLHINIMRGQFGVGEVLLVIYNLAMLAVTECVFAVMGDWRMHSRQLIGMAGGVWAFLGQLWKSKRE